MAARLTADAPVAEGNGPQRALQRLRPTLAPGRTRTVDKTVALYTSRDRAIADPLGAAVDRIGGAPGFDALLRTHRQAWDRLWCETALDVPGEAGRILRLHLFHVLRTLSPHTADLDVGVPARGLHGEAYRGHVFWDELFVLPFLDLHYPEVSRALLRHRYRRVERACAAARAIGRRGAMYPWQSASDGREESQALHLNPRSGRWLPDHSRLQRHVGSAVAYNVWRYCEATGDTGFRHTEGAETLLQIARFWADSATWVLARTLELLDSLPEPRRRELTGRMGLDDAELQRWQEVSRTLHIPFDTATSAAWTGSWRPRGTRSTATKPPNRPTS